jgi:hypothetical protein
MPSGTQKPKSVHKDIHTYKCNTKVKCTDRQLILQNNIFAVFRNHYQCLDATGQIALFTFHLFTLVSTMTLYDITIWYGLS